MQDLISLVTAAQQQDAEAFRALVVRFQDMAYAMAYGMTKDRDHAEDAAQEAFIEAYFQLSQLREPAAFPGWFRRIVHKHGDRVIRKKRLDVTPIDASGELPSLHPGPMEDLEANELRHLLNGAIDTLPEHERIVTSLFYITGYSYQEVADWLEIPVSTVKKRLHDARKRLKTRLMDSARDYLYQQRPSRQERFLNRVAFFLAIRNMDVPEAVRLLEVDPSLAHAREDRRETQFYQTMGAVGKREEKPPQKPEVGDGWSALHWAVSRGRPDLVTLLLDHGVDVNVRDWHRLTPLHCAAWYGYYDITVLLIEHGALVNTGENRLTPLHRAVQAGQNRVVRLLIEHGAAIDAANKAGLTALHFAAINGQSGIVEMLLAYGASPHVQDREGRTPMEWAALNYRDTIVEMLREHDRISYETITREV